MRHLYLQQKVFIAYIAQQHMISSVAALLLIMSDMILSTLAALASHLSRIKTCQTTTIQCGLIAGEI
jgi:hypothetical protein